MNDLISRTNALPSVNRLIVIRSKTLMPTKDFMEWAKRIREVNPNSVIIPCDAEVVSAETEWIPVSERLPNENGRYLVFYEGAIIGSHIEIMWYGEPLMPNVDVSGKHFYRSDSEWGDIIYDEVIAWMPLPKPYKEDE